MLLTAGFAAAVPGICGNVPCPVTYAQEASEETALEMPQEITEEMTEEDLSGTTVEFLAEDGAHHVNEDGYCALEKETDRLGRVIRETFLDSDLKPVVSLSDGFASRVRVPASTTFRWKHAQKRESLSLTRPVPTPTR